MIEPQVDAATRAHGPPLQRFAHDAMACTFELYLPTEDVKYARQAAEAAFKEVDRLEAELSHFIPTSDVARINALHAGQKVRVGIEIIECLQLAARVHADTGGAFDVAIGSQGEAAPPRAATPLQLDPQGRYVGARTGGVQVDLGGIGKGYTVDAMVAILRDWSITSGLVHAGQSTVFALGPPAGATDWSVAIRDPQQSDKPLMNVPLRDAALSGSGCELHGDHIIDPRSGRPVTDKLGAWAVAPSAALADALSTAFFVMSAPEIEAYCRQHPEVAGLVCGQRQGEAELQHFGRALSE
jgi:thiamine biosynthesis lipoprotein